MKSLELSDRRLINHYLSLHPPLISEMTFSNMFMWNEARETFFDVVDETLIFFILQEGQKVLFGPPIGPLPLDTVIKKSGVKKVLRSLLPSDSQMIKRWHFRADPAQADYVYLISDLQQLSGPRYQKKRQLVKGCLTRYSPSYEPISTNTIGECLDFLDRVFFMAGQEEGLLMEYQANRSLLNHFNDFDLYGGIIRIEGRIEAMVLGKKLNPTTYVAHLGKVSREFYGLWALMHNWLAIKCLNSCLYMNVEQDLGLMGLRDSKERFHPDHMIVKWSGEMVP